MPVLTPSTDLNAAFLGELFSYAEHSVFLTTLPNERGMRGIRHERLVSPSISSIQEGRARVIDRYDRDGQAVYFCVSTLSAEKVAARREREIAAGNKEPDSERSKEAVAEICSLHVDIDFKHIKLGMTDVCSRLAMLEKPPTAIVSSGNGAHLYWFLNEALAADADFVLDVEALLGKIAWLVGGDKACCEVARLMRVPGSHNTKGGAFKSVDVLPQHTDFARRYDFLELAEFFETHPPVVLEDEIIKAVSKRTGVARRSTDSDAPANPFEAYLRNEIAEGRFTLPPIDVERMLAAMTPGDGELGVHVVTRAVTASLVARGWTAAEIVPFVLGGVEAMVRENGLPSGWSANWQVPEERKIMGQVSGFERKQVPEKLARARDRHAREIAAPKLAFVDQEQKAATVTEAVEPAPTETTAPADTSKVVPLFKIDKTAPRPPAKRSDKSTQAHVRLAHLTLERMRMNTGQQFCFHRGELWIYGGPEGPRAGVWAMYDGKDATTYIETEIHGTIKDANAIAADAADEDGRETSAVFDEDAKLRTETRRYICTMPELRFTGEWDSHGLVPLANGLFDPATRTLTPFTPESRATYRFKAPYDAEAKFENGRKMIFDLFEPHGAIEAEKYVRLVQQFSYVAIFKAGKQVGRQLRRCLYFLGEQNSGKSQMVKLLRLAIGSEYSSATTLDELSDPAQRRFSLEALMNKILWAADEVASEKTKIDGARVKALLAEDPVKTDAKGKAAIEKQFLGAAVFSSNSYPRTLDSASGFSDRFMLVRCPAHFDNERPRGVALIAKQHGFSSPADFVAATELAGLVNWALEARDQIEKNMVFEQPKAVITARSEIELMANPAKAFSIECIEACSMSIASKSTDIYEAFREWHCEDNGSKTFCWSPQSFWKGLGAHFGMGRGLSPKSVIKHEHGRLAIGVRLTEAGMDYWRAADARRAAGDKSMPASMSFYEHSIAVNLDPDQLRKAAEHYGFSAGGGAPEEAISSKKARF